MTTEGASRSPEPQEVLRAALEYALGEVHTALPGRVEAYDPATQKADIKPLLQRLVATEEGDELLEELPVLPQVPVMFPRTQGAFITFPVAAGDHVLLVFNERSIDNFIAGDGEDTDPDEYRTHDLSDAVAFLGFYPDSKAIAEADNDTERLTAGTVEGGMRLHIAADHVEVTFDGGSTIKLEGKEADATLTLGGAEATAHAAVVEKLQALWESLESTLNQWGGASGHIHSTGVGPSGPPSPALTADAWDSDINSTKVSFPEG